MSSPMIRCPASTRPARLPRACASDKRGRAMIVAGEFEVQRRRLKIGGVVPRQREILPMLWVYTRVVPPPHDFRTYAATKRHARASAPARPGRGPHHPPIALAVPPPRGL